MKELLGLLQYVEASTEDLAIAKGINYLPKSMKEVWRRNRQTMQWQAKQIVNGTNRRGTD